MIGGSAGVEVDLQVIDAASRDRGQHVLDRVHGDRILAELRVTLGQTARRPRRNRRRAREIDSPKNHARRRSRRAERQLTRGAEVQPDSIE